MERTTPLLRGGDRVGDRLVVERPLGQGSYAEVYLVHHEFLGRQALKLLKRVASPVTTHRLLAEARVLARLSHPHVVRVFDAGTLATEEGLRGWFTTEYVAGGSLAHLVRAYRPHRVPTTLAVRVVEQLAAGLAAAHRQRPALVHRDVTLANVLVDLDGDAPRVRLGDFGLARDADPVTGRVGPQGTYAFMAPEALRGEGCSPASDVWSLGVVAYRLLTGALPYRGEPPRDFRSTRRRHAPPPPSGSNDEVDPELDRIVLAMLRPRPEDRPTDATEVVRLLTRRRATVRPRRPEPPLVPTAPTLATGAVDAPVAPSAPTWTSAGPAACDTGAPRHPAAGRPPAPRTATPSPAWDDVHHARPAGRLSGRYGAGRTAARSASAPVGARTVPGGWRHHRRWGSVQEWGRAPSPATRGPHRAGGAARGPHRAAVRHPGRGPPEGVRATPPRRAPPREPSRFPTPLVSQPRDPHTVIRPSTRERRPARRRARRDRAPPGVSAPTDRQRP